MKAIYFVKEIEEGVKRKLVTSNVMYDLYINKRYNILFCSWKTHPYPNNEGICLISQPWSGFWKISSPEIDSTLLSWKFFVFCTQISKQK